MKKMMILLAVMVMSIGSVMAAVGDELVPLDSQLGPNQTTYADYCVQDVEPSDQLVVVTVDPVCQDVDGISGCNGVDDHNPSSFSAVSMGDIQAVNGSGCTMIELTTTADAQGLYYYTVNGNVAEAEVASETGSVETVPEFGVLAAIGVLGLAGLFVYKRRD